MEAIKYKPANTMRICQCGCGRILCTNNKRYATLFCMYKDRKPKEVEVEEPARFPIWRCCDCGEEIQLNFYPASNSYNKTRFNKIVDNHKCNEA